LAFCYWSGLIHDNSSPLPASEQTLMLFTAHLSQTIKASSIKVYLSGVRSLHIEQGFKNPSENCVHLERLLHGVKRLQGTKQPITIAIFRKLYKIINLNNFSDALFWAACLTGFLFKFMTNSSHFHVNTNLSSNNIKVNKRISPTVVLINMKALKTDQFRHGHVLRIRVSGNNTCAVRALMNYLHHCGKKFGSLCLLQNGQPLSCDKFCTWPRDALTRIGETRHYTGHSFRIGTATTAAAVSIPEHLIKTLDRYGLATLINYIFKHPPLSWKVFPLVYGCLNMPTFSYGLSLITPYVQFVGFSLCHSVITSKCYYNYS
jgi:hypothetical protein